MVSDFSHTWTYIDRGGITPIDVTTIFNNKNISTLTIADTQADVLAAGRATRLGARTEEASKGAIDIVGKPLSSFTMGKAALDGVQRFLIASLGYWNRKSLYEIYRDGSGLQQLWNTPQVHMDYQAEESPYGSADCVRRNLEELGGDKPTFVMQLDNVFGEMDFKELLEFSKQKMAFMALVLTTVDDPSQYGTVRLDDNHRVTGMCEKSVLTLTEEDAKKLNPRDAVGESIRITSEIAGQLGLPDGSVGYQHIVTHEDAEKLEYTKLVGRSISLSKTQLQNLGYTKVNAGLYYLAPGARIVMNSEECINYFVNEGSDIGANFIGWLLRNGFPVYGYVMQEHSPISMERHGRVMWRDAGTPRELLETTMDIVQGRVTYYDIPGKVGDTNVYIMPGATDASRKIREELIRQIESGEIKADTTNGRVIIGEDVEIAPGTILQGPAYIGHQVKVGVKNRSVDNRIRISYSSLEPYSRVGIVDESEIPTKGKLGNHVVVDESIVGEHTIIVGGRTERNATVITGLEVEGPYGKTYMPTLIGGDGRIGAGSSLKGTEISPHHTIERGVHLIGAKFTSERVPSLPPTNQEQENVRREVEFSTNDPSQIHEERMRIWQRKAREFAVNLKQKDMLWALGRAEMEIHRAATIRQDSLSRENDRHGREMTRLYSIVDRIENAKPELDDKEQAFAKQALKKLGIEGEIDVRNRDTVKTIQYLRTASNLLAGDERRSAEALLKKAIERANISGDGVVKSLTNGLEPQIRTEIEISRMIKAIERTQLIPGDAEMKSKLRRDIGDTTKRVIEGVREGLLSMDTVADTYNPKLAKQRKRLG